MIMTNKEFSEAVDAYLNNTATSWQKFIVDDNFDSYEYGPELLSYLSEIEVRAIGMRMAKNIRKKIRYSWKK